MAKATKNNPNAAKSLAELMLRPLGRVGGLPNWALLKCERIGVITVGDLYRMLYLDLARPGFGPTFYSLAKKILTDMGLDERIGGRDPILAVARDSASRMRQMFEEGIPQRLAEHEAVVLAGADKKLAESENYYRDKIVRLTENFRRRERILTATLMKVTREEFSFTAPDVSPESATHWLVQYFAGRVPDGFVIEVDMECTVGSGLAFTRKTEIHLSALSVADILAVYGDHKDEMVSSRARFAPSDSVVGHDCEGIESTVEARFVARDGGQLAMLEGVVTVAGMSAVDIKCLFKPSDSAKQG